MTELKILIISIVIFVIIGLVAIFYSPQNKDEIDNIISDNAPLENDPITKRSVQEALQAIKRKK